MAILYIAGALTVCIIHIDQFGAVFGSIFKGAFALKAVGGGIVGSGVKLAITWGMKRGVFSNEAGLGSSVMVHSSSNVKEPVRQGMWGIFEVFADTIVVCTLTAFTVLSSGHSENRAHGLWQLPFCCLRFLLCLDGAIMGQRHLNICLVPRRRLYIG